MVVRHSVHYYSFNIHKIYHQVHKCLPTILHSFLWYIIGVVPQILRKVFKNEPRKTYKRKPLEKLTLPSPFKQTLSVQIFQRSLRQILLGSLLNNPAFI